MYDGKHSIYILSVVSHETEEQLMPTERYLRIYAGNLYSSWHMKLFIESYTESNFFASAFMKEVS